MKTKISTTFNTVRSNKYRMIFEGACTGILAGLLVSLFRLCLQKAETLRVSVLCNIKGFNEFFFIAIGLMVLAWIVLYLAVKLVPLCGGSGIPQVKGELLGKMEQPWLKIIVAKFIGGVFAIGSGLSLGREGPSIQLGAMVGKGYAKVTGKILNEEKMLMTCGAGAGLAGAFCAPLAGTVFALEELHKNFSTEILLSTMAASVCADFVSSYLFGLSPVFDLVITSKLPLNKYFLVLILGILLGCFGVFYNFITARIQDMYDKIPSRVLKVIFPYALVVIFALCYPEVLGSGHHLVSEVADGNFVLKSLVILLITKFIFSIVSFGSGVPGGIFLPLLVLGSISGGGFALLTSAGASDEYLANFVILGMTGLFASIVRSPITGVILITEMTGDFTNFLPLSLVALVSYLTADILRGEPVYEQLLDRMLDKDSKHGVRKAHERRKVLIESDVYIGSLMDGQNVEKMLLPKGCLIVSVERGHKEIVPDGSTKLKGGDKLTILCSQGDVLNVEEKLNNICRKIRR